MCVCVCTLVCMLYRREAPRGIESSIRIRSGASNGEAMRGFVMCDSGFGRVNPGYMYVCVTYVRTYVCMYVCTYVYMCVCVCMYACMYARMQVCVCMYV